jgi:hypothetical protein
MNETNDILSLYSEREDKLKERYQKYFNYIKEKNSEGYYQCKLEIDYSDKDIIDDIIECFKEDDIYAKRSTRNSEIQCYWKELTYKENRDHVEKKQKGKKARKTFGDILSFISIALGIASVSTLFYGSAVNDGTIMNIGGIATVAVWTYIFFES